MPVSFFQFIHSKSCIEILFGFISFYLVFSAFHLLTPQLHAYEFSKAHKLSIVTT